MSAILRYFSINADDVARARAFYEALWGWTFRAWGPPDHFQLQLPGMWAAIGGRLELIPGQRSNTFQLTFGVTDVHATLKAVQAVGGTVLMQPVQIEGGPEIAYVADSEGNAIGVGRYETEPPPGAPRLRHFAINADDVARAKRFYEGVFGWSFTPWGPPNSYHTRDAGAGRLGALQERRELRPGVRVTSLETTFEVSDMRATLRTVEAEGGIVLVQPFRIDGVGEISYFEDTEGNACGVAHYAPGVWA